MGCGCSSGQGERFYMQKTKLHSLDEFFDDVQRLLDELYEIKEPMEDSRYELLLGQDSIM